MARRLHVQVECQQGDRDSEHAVAERLCAALFHAVILPDQINRAPEDLPCVRPAPGQRTGPKMIFVRQIRSKRDPHSGMGSDMGPSL